MFLRPAEIDLTVPWMLSLRGRKTPGGEMLFLNEVDIRVEYAVWNVIDDEWNWEARAVVFDGPNPIRVTPESDPDLWKIIERGLNADAKELDPIVQDRIWELEVAA